MEASSTLEACEHHASDDELVRQHTEFGSACEYKQRMSEENEARNQEFLQAFSARVAEQRAAQEEITPRAEKSVSDVDFLHKDDSNQDHCMNAQEVNVKIIQTVESITREYLKGFDPLNDSISNHIIRATRCYKIELFCANCSNPFIEADVRVSYSATESEASVSLQRTYACDDHVVCESHTRNAISAVCNVALKNKILTEAQCTNLVHSLSTRV